MFRSVDLVELNRDFLNKAKTYLGAGATKVGKYFCCGLQDLNLAERKYDLIWIQWVTGNNTVPCIGYGMQKGSSLTNHAKANSKPQQFFPLKNNQKRLLFATSLN